MSVAATSCTAMTHATASPMPSTATGPPTATSNRHGSTPTSEANNATMPIPALAIMFSPHVCLNSSADRFTASIGPTCSITITGSTRNVTSDHAEPDQGADDPAEDPGALLDRADHERHGRGQDGPRQQHVGPGAGGVHGVADRHGLAAQALVGREHERGVEEHDDEGDGDVADDAEDPRERLRRSLRAVVGDERDRPEEHERDDERRQAREQRQAR